MERVRRSPRRVRRDPWGSADVGVESAVLDRIEFVDVSPVSDQAESLDDVASMPSVALLDYSPNASISARVPLQPSAPEPAPRKRTSEEPLWKRYQRSVREGEIVPHSKRRRRGRAGDFYPSGPAPRTRPACTRPDAYWNDRVARAALPSCRLCGSPNGREALHCTRCGVQLGSRSSGSGTGSLPGPRWSLWEVLSPLAVAAVVLVACGFLFSLV